MVDNRPASLHQDTADYIDTYHNRSQPTNSQTQGAQLYYQPPPLRSDDGASASSSSEPPGQSVAAGTAIPANISDLEAKAAAATMAGNAPRWSVTEAARGGDSLQSAMRVGANTRTFHGYSESCGPLKTDKQFVTRIDFGYLVGPRVYLHKNLLDLRQNDVTPRAAFYDTNNTTAPRMPTKCDMIDLLKSNKVLDNMDVVNHHHLLHDHKDDNFVAMQTGQGRPSRAPSQKDDDLDESPETPGASSSTDPFTTVPFGGILPETTQGMYLNPLTDVQVLLRQLLQNYEAMPLRDQRRASYRIQDIVDQTKQQLRSSGEGPQDSNWAQALAGLKNACTQATFLDLAIEERGLALIREALEALLVTVDRTAAYLDHYIVTMSPTNNVPERGGIARGARELPQQAVFRRLQDPSQLPAAPGAPAQTDPARGHLHDSTQGDSTPSQILRAQQILERIMPFLEQEVAAQLAEAHGLLFAWTAVLWGSPIFLLENAAVNGTTEARDHSTGEAPLGSGNADSPSDAPTQAFRSRSPAPRPRTERRTTRLASTGDAGCMPRSFPCTAATLASKQVGKRLGIQGAPPT
ncbi:unnamed protein product [Symbiodinium sp. CCMP2592]|nr:unnamed protein product [Symbiodinium sp. CCMP2592]